MVVRQNYTTALKFHKHSITVMLSVNIRNIFYVFNSVFVSGVYYQTSKYAINSSLKQFYDKTSL